MITTTILHNLIYFNNNISINNSNLIIIIIISKELVNLCVLQARLQYLQFHVIGNDLSHVIRVDHLLCYSFIQFIWLLYYCCYYDWCHLRFTGRDHLITVFVVDIVGLCCSGLWIESSLILLSFFYVLISLLNEYFL